MTITEIAQEAIDYSPGWGIRCGDLQRIADKHNVDSKDVFNEMVRLGDTNND